MINLKSGRLLLGVLAATFAFSSIANTIEIEAVTGPIGGTVDVNYSFTSAPPDAAGFEYCMEFDPLLTVNDTSQCVAGAPAGYDGAFTNCTNTPACATGVTITINANNFTDVLPTMPVAGTITFNVDAGAADGAILPITGTCIALNAPIGDPAIGCADLTIVDGSVEASAGPPAVLDVTPPNINFGTGVAPTTLGPETVTIANTGAAGAPDLTVNTLGFSGADAAQFSTVGGSCAATPFDLAQGASCTVDIELDANAVAVFTADFDVDSSVGAAAVALTGEGTAGPQSTLTITPNPMAFGVVDLGTLPVTDTFVAENTGDAGSSLTISAFTLAGDPEFTVVTDGCSAATLNAGDTCSVEIQFDSAANGVFAGTGSFASDANTGANQDIAITGEADSVADLQITPPFGPVNLGAGPAGSTVSANGTVVNNGSAAGTFDCSIGGPDAAVFSVTPDLSGGITVDPGDTADFVLACDLPGGAADGDVFNATLTCAGDLVGTHELSCSVGTIEFIPVPTMQPWALALFALMMLIVGGFSIRFFRAS